MMLVITPNSRYKMAMNTTTWYPSIGMSRSHLFLWYVVGVAGLWCTIFENLKLGRRHGLMAHKNVIKGWGMSLQQGKNASFCYNWDMVYSSANNFSLEPILNMFIFVATHTTLDAIMAKPKRILHIVGGRELLLCLFVRWRRGVMFAQSHCTKSM